MKNFPLTNPEKFKNCVWTIPWPPNGELFRYGWRNYHYQLKNSQREGINIIWKGNPFGIDGYCNYCVLEK